MFLIDMEIPLLLHFYSAYCLAALRAVPLHSAARFYGISINNHIIEANLRHLWRFGWGASICLWPMEVRCHPDLSYKVHFSDSNFSFITRFSMKEIQLNRINGSPFLTILSTCKYLSRLNSSLDEISEDSVFFFLVD